MTFALRNTSELSSMEEGSSLFGVCEIPKFFSDLSLAEVFRLETHLRPFSSYIIRVPWIFRVIHTPVKQWQAVKTQLGLIIEPAHTWTSSSIKATCQGHAPSLLTLPPTIRLSITLFLVIAIP